MRVPARVSIGRVLGLALGLTCRADRDWFQCTHILVLCLAVVATKA